MCFDSALEDILTITQVMRVSAATVRAGEIAMLKLENTPCFRKSTALGGLMASRQRVHQRDRELRSSTRRVYR